MPFAFAHESHSQPTTRNTQWKRYDYYIYPRFQILNHLFLIINAPSCKANTIENFHYRLESLPALSRSYIVELHGMLHHTSKESFFSGRKF